MNRFLLAAAFVAVATFGAHAQATRTWVSGVGDDVNPCSRTAPCKTFAGAISKTAAGGAINSLDQGAYGTVTMTKSMTLDGTGTLASILHSATSGIVINGAGVIAKVREIGILGGSPVSGGINGIRFVSGASLLVEDTRIEDQLNATAGNGINFEPTTAASLTIRNVQLNNASAGAGAAIRIKTNGQNVIVSLENVQVTGGVVGIMIDTTLGGLAKISIKDSTFANIAGPGIAAYSGNGDIRLYLDNVTSVNNNHGLVANGARTTAWLGSSTIAGNIIGIHRAGNSSVFSYKDNYIFNNTTEGTPLPASPTPVQGMPSGEIASAAGR